VPVDHGLGSTLKLNIMPLSWCTVGQVNHLRGARLRKSGHALHALLRLLDEQPGVERKVMRALAKRLVAVSDELTL
jgi:hypothetical protein